MQRTKKECPYCKSLISLSNFSKHLNACDGVPKDDYNDRLRRIKDGNLTCKYCGRICANGPGLGKHEKHCRKNPNRTKLIIKGNPFCTGNTPWIKGKTAANNKIIKEAAQKKRARYASGELVGSMKGKHHSEQTKEKLSEIAKRNNFGGHFYRGGEVINGIKLESSYEVTLVKSLIENNIRWEKPKCFYYLDLNNKKHRYLPDVYLPDYNIYLDPKNDYLIENINPSTGYKDVDKIKWVCEQNNVKIFILDKTQLTWSYVSEHCIL